MLESPIFSSLSGGDKVARNGTGRKGGRQIPAPGIPAGEGQDRARRAWNGQVDMTDERSGFRAATAAISVCAALMLALLCGAAQAEPKRGQVTNLPIPRFVSMKATEGNVRRGPSLSHRIDWVYRRKDLPLRIIAEFGNWRQVRDIDGAGGWVHYSLLSGVRTVMVEAPTINMMTRPQDDSHVEAIVEKGVIARLGECTVDWCEIRKDGHKGWVQKTALWGVAPDEVRD